MEGHGVLGFREMVGGVFRFWDRRISADGAWWILAINAIFLIPLIFAGFFFPATALIVVGVATVVTLGALALRWAVHGGSGAR